MKIRISSRFSPARRRGFLRRNVALHALCGGTLLCLSVSALIGQQVPTPPPAAAGTNAAPSAGPVQVPSTAPLQAGLASLPPSTAGLPVTLNLRAWLGYPTASFNVNGTGIERFGISTGLNANTLTPATVDRLKIPSGKSKVRVNILDREAEALDTTLKSLQVGLLKLENVPIAQVDVVSLVSHTPHPDAPAGWLGVPFLSSFTVILDMSRRICVLERPNMKMPAGALIVPMTLRDGHIFVPMTLPKSKPIQAMLDTGSVLTLIPASIGEKLKLTPLETVKLGSAGKEVKASLILAPQVAVGKAECKSLRVAYLSDDASPTLGRETAVLGLDFLSRYKVVLNFAAKKVAFVPLTTGDETPAKPDVKQPSGRPQYTPRRPGQTSP